MQRVFVASAILAFSWQASAPAVLSRAGAREPVYPGKTWAHKAPGEVGLDPARLDAFRDYVRGRGCVVRHGYMVYGWGDQARRADVASACKPWYTHFLFKAIEEGRLEGIDSPVRGFEPRLDPLNAALGFKDRNILWRHLACQTSGYGVQEPPGAAFDYSDYNITLFFDTLFLKVYGTTWEKVDADVLHPKLTDPLQCEDRPTLMAFGTENRPGRLGISVRDFARFGLLYLRKGNWSGRPLLAEKHATTAVSSPLAASLARTKGRPAEMIPRQRSIGGGNNQTDHYGGYSFTWWVNGVGREGRRLWPDAPPDAFGAFGHGDIRAMVVIPDLDLIVSWNDAKTEGPAMTNQALRLLVEAVVSRRGARKAGI